jgi:O-antigen/teichoic acid export membrane protein
VTSPLSRHSGRWLAQSVLWNALGQGFPLLVGVVALPVIIRGLGTPAFGAFQLAWAVLGYFALLDLGLGRATTKFVAEYAAKGDTKRIWDSVTASLAVQAVLGTAGALVLAALVPFLVGHAFRIPPELVPDVKRAFYLLPVAIPVVLLGSSLSGVLQAVQRFDLVNLVQGVTGAATYALPVAVLSQGGGVAAVVAAVIGTRVAALLWYALLVPRELPPRPARSPADRELLQRLLSFGGWVTVSSVVSPLMVYLDRALLGSVLSLTAVAYYTAPYDIVARLSIVAASIIPPLFPAFSALEGIGERARLEDLFLRAARLLALATAPVVATVILVARPALNLWLGPEFAANSTLLTQLLAAALLVNSMAQLPYALLQGLGRADLPAKFHLLELPVYAGLLWLGIRWFGTAGAAGAWLLRVTLDAGLLYGSALRTQGIAVRRCARTLANALVVPGLGFLCLAGPAAAFTDDLVWRVASIAGGLAAFAVGAWWYSLDQSERAPLRRLFGGRTK